MGAEQIKRGLSRDSILALVSILFLLPVLT